MARAVQRTAARRDFIIHYAYLAEEAGLGTAQRFRHAVEETYAELAEMPGIGAPGKVRQGKHEGVRIWRVRGFEEYLIAYRPRRGGVAIERLVHAKQDYQRILK
ncbi:MAG: type II toxin-antitoxin system RelE/ParE family toxin [Acidobacteriia bacterium]|nr:type II toxin-antitoxin system RelE/ParE family toxin [Terriglobia bacterium]